MNTTLIRRASAASAMAMSILALLTLGLAKSSAAPVTFTDEATFLGATGPQALESFESETATNNTSQAGNLVLSDFTLTSDTTFGVLNAPTFGQSASDGTNCIGSINNGTTTLAFDDAISTFGINILDFGDFGSGNLTFSNGVDSFTAAVPGSDGNIQFFGIISEFAFTNVSLSHSNDGESNGLDEVYTALFLNQLLAD